MNNVYLRSKNSLKRIILNYLLALLPLILAGFYKNGIKLYLNGLVSIYGLFKPLIFDILGFIIGIIVNIIYIKLIKKDSLKGCLFSSFYPIYGLLIASTISINTNILLFIICTFIILFISNFIKENKVNLIALTSLIIIFISKILGNFTFLNIYEKSNTLTLNSIDYLIGRGSGGINTSHVLLLIVSLIILCNMKTYKKEIPLYTSIFYSLFMIIYCVVINKPGLILDNIFANGILFSFVFIAPDSLSSSYTNKGKFIYSLIISIATFGLYLIYPPLASLGGIIIASIMHSIIDKICER